MGIGTKVVKRIVQAPDVVRPGKPGTWAQVLVCDAHPRYAVVYDEGENLVITVVFRTECDYVRDGHTFTSADSKSS